MHFGFLTIRRPARVVVQTAVLVCTGFALSAQSPPDPPVATTITYGGSGSDIVNAIAVDPSGNIYLTGRTDSTDLPGKERAFRQQPRGTDAFVAKLDAAGTVLWSTYLGGNDARSGTRFSTVIEEARAIALDGSGNVWVAGLTGSTDFPAVNAFQSSAQANRSGGSDGFLAKLNPSGTQLLASTYLGGADGNSSVEALAVGPTGDAWVAVRTSARQFPTSEDLSPASAGFLVLGRFAASGAMTSLTRLGFGDEIVGGLAVDGLGQPHVSAFSPRSPCSRGVAIPYCAGWYVKQLNAAANATNFTWALEAAQSNTGGDLAIGPGGTIVVAGSSASRVTTINPWEPTPPLDSPGGFIAVLTSRGVPTAVSTLAGATSQRLGVAIDVAGMLHVGFDTPDPLLPSPRSVVPHHPDGPLITSDDRGASWQWASRGVGVGVQQMAFDATRNYVYAFNGASVSRSIDNGSSWQFWGATDGFPGAGGGVAVDPLDPTTVYAGSRGLFRFDGDGRSSRMLRESGAGVGGFRVETLAVSPHDGSVWVGTGNGLEASFDRGLTWSRRDRGFHVTVVGTIETPRLIVFDQRRPGTVYAGLTEALLRSSDNGLNWEDITATARDDYGFPERPFVRAVAIDPSNSDRVYAGTFNRGILVTSDGGRTWTKTLPFAAVQAMAVDHVPPYQVYASVRQYSPDFAGILVSRDQGQTWSRSDTGVLMRDAPSALYVHPGDPARLYAAMRFVAAAPYLSRLQPSGQTPPYAQSLGSYLLNGNLRDVTVSPDRTTVLALNLTSSSRRDEIAIVRLAP